MINIEIHSTPCSGGKNNAVVLAYEELVNSKTVLWLEGEETKESITSRFDVQSLKSKQYVTGKLYCANADLGMNHEDFKYIIMKHIKKYTPTTLVLNVIDLDKNINIKDLEDLGIEKIINLKQMRVKYWES